MLCSRCHRPKTQCFAMGWNWSFAGWNLSEWSTHFRVGRVVKTHIGSLLFFGALVFEPHKAPLCIRKYMLDSCHLCSSSISILGRWYVCVLPGPWWRRTNQLLSWSGLDSKGMFLTSCLWMIWMIPTLLQMCHLMGWQVTCLSPGHIAFVLSTTKLDLTKSQLRRPNHQMISSSYCCLLIGWQFELAPLDIDVCWFRFGFTTRGELAVSFWEGQLFQKQRR